MDIQEHITKKALKCLVDNNFEGKIRADLKNIIDASKSIDELAQTLLVYFAAFHG